MADIRVFISSVQREFAQERRQLCDYIRTDGLLGRFFVPFIFEDMPDFCVQPPRIRTTPTAVTSPLTPPPTDEREMTVKR